MSRVVPVTLTEFLLLVEYAQKHHAEQNEPIPQVHPSQHEKIKACLDAPFQTWDGRLLYQGFYTKAAVLFYLLCKNHPLTNGNKRMACITLGYFCKINNHPLQLEPTNFYNIAKIVTNSDPQFMEVVLDILRKAFRNILNWSSL